MKHRGLFMSSVKMSIHRGLAELNILDDRIKKSISQKFLFPVKNNADMVNGVKIEEIKNQIKGNFETTTSLIDNRKKIKDAITLSNATTKITLGNEEMTVAEAIERKNSIHYEEEFLRTLKIQSEDVSSFIESKEREIPNGLERYLTVVLGEKEKRKIEEVDQYTKKFYDDNKYVLIEPVNSREYIKLLEKRISDFKLNVDYALSESNATTFIEVKLND